MSAFKRKPKTQDVVTLFFASDLHGSDVCWKKFVATSSFYRADILILGGDFTGKLLIPVVQTSSDKFEAQFMGKQHSFSGADELDSFNSRVSNSGFYPITMGHDRYEELQGSPDKIENLFAEQMTERLIKWIHYAKEKLQGSTVTILTAPANDDPYFVDDVISEHGDGLFINVENEVVNVAPGHQMISSGYTNRTPWDTPREFDESVILEHINQMADRLEDVSSSIFNLHPPPYGGKLDVAPKLTKDLEIVTSTGATVMENVGSIAVREAIEKHQPLLSFHGHIHEAAGQEKIGRTVAINPGSEYGEGVLKGALVRVGGGRIHSYQATSG